MAAMDFLTEVKLRIYSTIADSTWPPAVDEVAADLNSPREEVQQAYLALSGQRLLVLEPGQPHKIRMAPPFSGIQTIHSVQVGGRSYYANCAWDALGIAAALHKDADIESECSDCGEILKQQVRNFQPVNQSYVAHFAVPSAHWWDDIIET